LHIEQSWLAATHFGNATKLTNPLRNDPLVHNTMDIREAVVTPANSTNSVRAANKTPGLAATHFGNATKLTNPLRNDPLVHNTVNIREAVVTPANSTNSVRAANKTPDLQQRISETPRN